MTSWHFLYTKNCEFYIFRHGRLIARYPFRYIVACLLVTISLGSGIYFMHWETNIVRLWNPENSESGMNFKWLWQNHPPDLRRHSILFKAENMLSKHSLKQVRNMICVWSKNKWLQRNFRVSRVMTRLNIIIIDGSSTKTIAFSSNTQWIYLERCVPKVSK